MASGTTNHWKLGLFVLMALGVFTGTLIWLGALQFDREVVRAVTFFDESVDGLEIGSPVRFRGVKIGSVSEVRIAPDRRLIEVHCELYVDEMERLGLAGPAGAPGAAREDAFVPANVRVMLVSSILTGIKYVQVDLLPMDSMANYKPLKLAFKPPWNYVPSQPSFSKSIQDWINVAQEELPALKEQVVGILTALEVLLREDAPVAVSNLNQVLDEVEVKVQQLDLVSLQGHLEGLLARAEEVLSTAEGKIDAVEVEHLNQLVANLQGLVEPETGDVPRLMAQLEGTTREARQQLTEARVGDTTAALRDTAGAVTELSQQLTLTSQGLEGDVSRMTDELGRTLVELQATLARVRALAQELERYPGSLIQGRSYDDEPGGSP